MIFTTVIILSLLHTVISFKKPLWGVCTLLAIKMLVPDTVRSPLAFLSLNSFCSLALFLAWIKGVFAHSVKLGKEELGLVHYVGILTVLCFLVFIFGDFPLSRQFPASVQYFTLQIFPVLVAASVINDKDSLTLVLKVFVCSSLICMVYGIFCFLTFTPYPYNQWIVQFYTSARGVSNYEDVTTAEMGGIAGRIMGTVTSDTWSYGMVICILFSLFYCLYDKTKQKILLACTILAAVSCLFTVRRTPLMVLFSFIITLMLFRKKTNMMKWICVGLAVCVFLYFFLNLFPQFKKYSSILETVLFFWDDSVAAKNNVSGSSLEFRLFQLDYTLNQISDSPIFGNGWASMYQARHHRMIGWESMLFTSLMQFGYLGFMIWMGWFYKLYKYSIQHTKDKSLGIAFMLSSLMLCFVNDTIYPFFIFFGAVLLNKTNRFYGINKRNYSYLSHKRLPFLL